jgi:hypothetical protein
VATIERALQSKAKFGLVVRYTFTSTKLGQSAFDFGQKYQPLSGIVNGGICRHRLEGLVEKVCL